MPEVSTRDRVAYAIPEDLEAASARGELRLLRTAVDWGPATKLLPVLLVETDPETIIVTLDDDVDIRHVRRRVAVRAVLVAEEPAEAAPVVPAVVRPAELLLAGVAPAHHRAAVDSFDGLPAQSKTGCHRKGLAGGRSPHEVARS